MQAIILAAGMGKRLKDLTQNNTKCMVSVNGITLIDRMLHQIEKQNLSRIIIVVGYEGQKLIEYIDTLNISTPILYIENPIYNKTNNIYSLSLAKEYLLQEDTLLFESDLIFEDAVLDTLLTDPRDSLVLVDKYESWMDGTCVKLSKNDTIEAFVPGKKFKFNDIHDYYKTVNIYKFSKHFSETHYVPFLDAYTKALGLNEYYEQVLRIITMLDEPIIKAKKLSGELWYEIDDIQDLDIASSMFTVDESKKLFMMQQRNGGYWRYPKLIDCTNSSNCFFPPQKLLNELKANAEKLITQPPSNVHIHTLLASKNYNIPQENILVGSTTNEILDLLKKCISGELGIVQTPFDDCLQKNKAAISSVYTTPLENLAPSATEIIDYFNDKKIKGLLLSNPCITVSYTKDSLDSLITWTQKKNCILIIDESFMDFADNDTSSLFNRDFLVAHPHVFVLKNISVNRGITGLQLCILASGNVKMIQKIKPFLTGINSVAEFYLQIEEKYNSFFSSSLTQMKQEHTRFVSLLKAIPHITIVASETSYVVIKLDKKMTSKHLAEKLLTVYNILVTQITLSSALETQQFLVTAIKSTEENNYFIRALQHEFE